MPVEFIGWTSPQVSSEIIPATGPVFSSDVLAHTARVHEAAGFDRVLIGYFTHGADGFMVGAHTAAVTERLAHLLLHLADLYGVEDAEGVAIGTAFTHADLAHMVGATRQWVTISLRRLQEQGILVCRRSQIIVRRRDLLAEMRGRGA